LAAFAFPVPYTREREKVKKKKTLKFRMKETKPVSDFDLSPQKM
jgi:hypothetical protein